MNYNIRNKQSGAVLAISLVLLSIITLLAAMNMQRAGLQTRIATNILHSEQKGEAALNEQELLFFRWQNAKGGDAIIQDPLRSFIMVNGEREYLPVVLATPNRTLNYIQVNSRLIIAGSEPGTNALAQGEDASEQRLYRYELWTTANIRGQTQGRSSTEYQVTGMTLPSLNFTKNSLYAAP
tara:strand:- start:4579 stop:5121 length:543 start_codon:yes stop_codon:yes gene_type:complete